MTTNMPVQSVRVESVADKDCMEQVCVTLKHKFYAIGLIIGVFISSTFRHFLSVVYVPIQQCHLVNTESKIVVYQLQI